MCFVPFGHFLAFSFSSCVLCVSTRFLFCLCTRPRDADTTAHLFRSGVKLEFLSEPHPKHFIITKVNMNNIINVLPKSQIQLLIMFSIHKKIRMSLQTSTFAKETHFISGYHVQASYCESSLWGDLQKFTYPNEETECNFEGQ